MANVYGYARVSSRDQNEDRQMTVLQELSIPEKIYFWISSQEKILKDLLTNVW